MTNKIATSKAVAAVLIALLFAVACQTGHLSRSNLKSRLDKIAKQAQQQNPDGPHTLLVSIGTVADCEPNRIRSGYDPVEDDASSQVLSATGYLTIRPIKQYVWEVQLTERGKESIAGEKYGHEQVVATNGK